MGPKNISLSGSSHGSNLPDSTPLPLTTDKDILWKQYELQVELYKKY